MVNKKTYHVIRVFDDRDPLEEIFRTDKMYDFEKVMSANNLLLAHLPKHYAVRIEAYTER